MPSFKLLESPKPSDSAVLATVEWPQTSTGDVRHSICLLEWDITKVTEKEDSMKVAVVDIVHMQLAWISWLDIIESAVMHFVARLASGSLFEMVLILTSVEVGQPNKD